MGEGRVARSVLYHTNFERHHANLQPLRSNRLLIRAAHSHSEFLAQTRAFSHEGPGWRSTASVRVEQEGYAGATAENIWLRVNDKRPRHSRLPWRNDWELGRSVVADWMASPGHRDNILNPAFTEVGIGVAHTRSRIYLTQNFGVGLEAQKIPRWLLMLGLGVFALSPFVVWEFLRL